MCVPTAEPYVEPTNNVDTEMAICKLKNRKATGYDQIPQTDWRGKKSSKKSLMDSFKKYGRTTQYHMGENVASQHSDTKLNSPLKHNRNHSWSLISLQDKTTLYIRSRLLSNMMDSPWSPILWSDCRDLFTTHRVLSPHTLETQTQNHKLLQICGRHPNNIWP